MSHSLRCAGVVALLLAGGCGAPAVAVPPNIPIVPVTFENNLVTSRECEFRGTALDLFEASSLDANLVIAVVFDRASFTHNGITRVSQGMRGKAVRCPKATVDRVVRAFEKGGST